MAIADYRLFIDWADDGFRHPLAAIPPEDVLEAEIDWGTTLDDVTREIRCNIDDGGRVLLFNEDDGRYYHGRGGITREQLQARHDFKLEIDGRQQRFGKTYRIGPPFVGPDIEAAVYAFEPFHGDALRSYATYEGPDGSAQAVVRDVSFTARIFAGCESQVALENVSQEGTWLEFFQRIAAIVTGWVMEDGGGNILVLSEPLENAREPNWDFGTTDLGFSRDACGTRDRTEGVLTVVEYFNHADPPELVHWPIGNQGTYGRRVLRLAPWIPDSLGGAITLANVVAHNAEPDILVRLEVADEHDDPAVLGNMTRHLVPGRKVAGSVPTEDTMTRHAFTILRTRLIFGWTRVPTRTVWGVVPNLAPEVGPGVRLGDPEFTVAANRLSAVMTVASTANDANRYWRFRAVGTSAWSSTMSYVADEPVESVTLSPLTVDTAYEVQVSTSSTFTSANTVHATFNTNRANVAPPPVGDPVWWSGRPPTPYSTTVPATAANLGLVGTMPTPLHRLTHTYANGERAYGVFFTEGGAGESRPFEGIYMRESRGILWIALIAPDDDDATDYEDTNGLAAVVNAHTVELTDQNGMTVHSIPAGAGQWLAPGIGWTGASGPRHDFRGGQLTAALRNVHGARLIASD